MTVNQRSLDLIKEFEGWQAKAYPDPATGGVPWTIGYGHTSRAGRPTVAPGLTVTKSEGEAILQRDLATFAAAVRAKVTVELNDNQFGALVSFCMNVGPGNFNKSSVLKRVNAGLFDQVPARLVLWNKAAGKVMRGLTRRREAEGILFMTPVKVLQAPIPAPRPNAPKTPPKRSGGLVKAIIAGLTILAGAVVAYLKAQGLI